MDYIQIFLWGEKNNQINEKKRKIIRSGYITGRKNTILSYIHKRQ